MAVALVVAAGQGERLGASGPKAFVRLHGRPLLDWTLDALRAAESIEGIVVALPAGYDSPVGTTGVTGGATRSASVQAALAAVPATADPILIHDAARPLVTPELIDLVLAGLAGADAAIAAAPVTNTTKEAGPDGIVLRTLDRTRLWSVQTPQAFRRSALELAYTTLAPEEVAQATDEAQLIERAGGSVRVVAAPAENLKVTTPLDLLVAEQLLARRG
jgi:2-C-methyl-D-erythritol 4-phosphate cytidylyltransferase